MSLEQEFLSKIENHKGVIFKIAKMYGNSSEDISDLYQEIIYQSWKSYSRFKGNSKFSTWLYRVALNTAITYLNKEKKSPFYKSNDISQHQFISEEYSSDKDDKLVLMYQAISQLNAIDKALVFYFLEGFSGADIANELGISQVNVRVKLNRAKMKLKTFINSQNNKL